MPTRQRRRSSRPNVPKRRRALPRQPRPGTTNPPLRDGSPCWFPPLRSPRSRRRRPLRKWSSRRRTRPHSARPHRQPPPLPSATPLASRR
ncbi:hypothetical protein D7W81_37635 [Corallococcus aberystwythensis]|uniref:Uncharacterized protein n=1 Tax=Corallococcus aberystwythensis TaxID=2316722 RepID=A0A3A8PJJ3_9BACT|nr:hypothetical protein D7W81_37635 [Corallococcus aberystwythensis]